MGIIYPAMAPLDSSDLMQLEKLVSERQSEIKREEREGLELRECSFKPRVLGGRGRDSGG